MGNMVRYKNGNYFVMLDTDNGTKIRYNNEDELIPHRPESMDITISKYCEVSCPFCYAGCSKDGKHADIMTHSFIDNLEPYTELALNGNEPLHPDLVPFLNKCRKLKLIPSLTVNQNTFMKNVDLLKKLSDNKLIYGLGVSLTNPSEEFIEAVKRFPNAVIHTIAGITEKNEYEALAHKGLKILVLGYKMVGRGKDWHEHDGDGIAMRINGFKSDISKMIDENWFNVVSFDNLALEQLDIKSLMSEDKWRHMYMGDDGFATFYVDLVEKKFYKNSMSTNGHKLTDNPNEMFNIIHNEN